MTHDLPDRLRAALRAVPNQVAVLLAHDGLEVRGATVTAFMSVSLEPPTLAVGVGLVRRVYGALEVGAPCSLNMLAAGQEPIADHFASSVARETGVSTIRLARDESGAPVVRDARAVIRAQVLSQQVAGDHAVLLLRVDDVTTEDADSGSEPLLWHQGGYAYLDR